MSTPEVKCNGRRTIANPREEVTDALTLMNMCAAAVVGRRHRDVASTGQEVVL